MNAKVTPDEMVGRLKTKPDVITLVQEIKVNPQLIPVYLDIIRQEPGSAKFLAEKVLRSVSEVYPDLLYPYFFDLAAFLDTANSFIKWGSIITLSNLLESDCDEKFLEIFDHYFSLLNSPTMITAANVVGNAWKIVKRYPEREPDITKRLLLVTNNTYFAKGKPSPECKNVLYGHMIDCFDRYFPESQSQPEILDFVYSQQDNPRPKVARAAQLFIKRHSSKQTHK